MDGENNPERRTLLAVFLCFLIYLGWTFFQLQKHKHDAPPPEAATAASAATPDKPTNPQTALASGAVPGTAPGRAIGELPQQPGAHPPASEALEQLITLESPEFHLVLSSHGGTLVEATLKSPQYRREVDGKLQPVDLARKTPEGSRPLETTFDGLKTLSAEAAYEATPDADGRGVRFVRHEGSATIEKHFMLVAPYLAELDVQVQGVDPGRVQLPFPGDQPPGSAASSSLFGLGRSVPNASTGICRMAGSTQRSAGGPAKDIKVKTETFPGTGDGALSFIGLDERFFMGAAYPAGPERQGRCTLSSLASGTVFGSLDLPLKAGETERFGVYLGPKDFDLLGRDSQLPGQTGESAMLQGSVDFGFWTALCVPMLLAMQFFFEKLVHNWGLAILLLTLAIKLVLFPLQQRFFKTQEKMRLLAPQLEELKKKHGSDKERLNMEMMKLYSDNGANPFSSCLPMLLQMPIWFALYRLLGTTIQLYREPFIAGWINDLTAPDPYFALPLGMGGTMVVTQLLTPQTTLDSSQQKMMVWIMPVLFTAMFLKVPAGLSLYIVSSNILNIAQQAWLRRRYGAKPPPDVVETDKGKQGKK